MRTKKSMATSLCGAVQFQTRSILIRVAPRSANCSGDRRHDNSRVLRPRYSDAALLLP